MFKDHNDYSDCESFVFLCVIVVSFVYFAFFT